MEGGGGVKWKKIKKTTGSFWVKDHIYSILHLLISGYNFSCFPSTFFLSLLPLFHFVRDSPFFTFRLLPSCSPICFIVSFSWHRDNNNMWVFWYDCLCDADAIAKIMQTMKVRERNWRERGRERMLRLFDYFTSVSFLQYKNNVCVRRLQNFLRFCYCHCHCCCFCCYKAFFMSALNPQICLVMLFLVIMCVRVCVCVVFNSHLVLSFVSIYLSIYPYIYLYFYFCTLRSLLLS